MNEIFITLAFILKKTFFNIRPNLYISLLFKGGKEIGLHNCILLKLVLEKDYME